MKRGVAHDLRAMNMQLSVPHDDGRVRALCGRLVGPAVGNQYALDRTTRQPIVTCKDCLRYRRTHSYAAAMTTAPHFDARPLDPERYRK